MAGFPDIFACVSCEKAIFVDEKERDSEKFVCSYCQHEHTIKDVQGADEPDVPGIDAASIEDAASEEPIDQTEKELESTPKKPKIELSQDDPNGDDIEPEPKSELLSDKSNPSDAEVEVLNDELIESESGVELVSEAVSNENDDTGITIPENLKLPDVFACLSCENALFLNDNERKSGDFSCPHCGEKNDALETRAVAAEKIATVEETPTAPPADHKFDELIECPNCEKAIKLIEEERDEESVNCPYCKFNIEAPELPVEEELSKEVGSKDAETINAPSAESKEEDVQENDIDIPDPQADEQEGEAISEESSELGDTDSEESSDNREGEEGSELDPETDEPEEAEGLKIDKALLKTLVQSSRDQVAMPERFSCAKCETDIYLPESERPIGLSFCPECEELINSKTAQENSIDEPESIDAGQDAEALLETGKVGEESVASGEGPSDAESSVEQVENETESSLESDGIAPEMEFWLLAIMPTTVDCSKCSNSLKLEDTEKMFGMYRCPYCKADINHAKGNVVESLAAIMDEEEEGEETESTKRKSINIKALLPYAAILVFGVVLNYSVIKVTGYIQEKRALKAQWILRVESIQTQMMKRSRVYKFALENSTNKADLARLDEMSLKEIMVFRERLSKGKEEAYAKWFEEEGERIANDKEFGSVVGGFKWDLKRFFRRVNLAKIDADNLEETMGMSEFERQRAHELLERHIGAINEQMDALSDHEAIKGGLVRPNVLNLLMKLSLMVNFEMHSVKEAGGHLTSVMAAASEIAYQYGLWESEDPGKEAAYHKEDESSHASISPLTLWNAEIKNWHDLRYGREHDHRNEWEEVILRYEQLVDSLSEFHLQLKSLKNGLDMKQLNHPFLSSAVLPLKVDEFRELDKAGDLVSRDVNARLGRLSKLLDPYALGSLAYDLKMQKNSGLKLTNDQAGEYYDRFWEEWKQFHLEQGWFDLEGVSSYYHLARADGHHSGAPKSVHH